MRAGYPVWSWAIHVAPTALVPLKLGEVLKNMPKQSILDDFDDSANFQLPEFPHG